MEVKEIAIKEVTILENIRQKVNYDDMGELMDSIKVHGLFQPIGVKETKDGYILIWGYRRFIAFKKLDYKTIPAVIFKRKEDDLTEEDFLVANAAENIHRKDVNQIELGRVCFALRKKLSILEVAAKLGVPKTRVKSAIESFLRVPEKHRGRVRVFSGPAVAGQIGSSVASSVIHIRNLSDKQKEQIFDWALKEQASQKTINVLGQLLKEGYTIKQAISELKDARLIEARFVVRGKAFDKILDKENATITSLFRKLIVAKYRNILY